LVNILIKSECDAIHRQCASGPESISNIFRNEIISPEAVPAGLFVRVLSDILHATIENRTDLSNAQNCVAALHGNRIHILSSILLVCSDPSSNMFCDPRPALTEAWLIAITHLIAATKTSSAVAVGIVAEIFCDTALAVFALLLYPTVGKRKDDRWADPGQSLDGPQSLALTDFLAAFFSLGPDMLQRVASNLAEQVPVVIAAERHSFDSLTKGAAIAGATLFRAVQGGLPPWAVESVPDVFSNFYLSFNRSPEGFGRIIRLSMTIRLDPTAPKFGGVEPGGLLSGPCFDALSTEDIDHFVEDAMNMCRDDDNSSWRRFKVAVKRICGGKKKDTDFQLKPAYTRWDFDRM
jgi:hypothetical protein